MRTSVQLKFTEGKTGKQVWQTRASLEVVKTRAADVNDGVAEAEAQIRARLRYTDQLNPILSAPTKYNVEFINYQVPKTQIRKIQRVPGRSVLLEL